MPLRDGDLVVGPAGFGVYIGGRVRVGGKSFDASEFRRVPPNELPKAWAAIGWPMSAYPTTN